MSALRVAVPVTTLWMSPEAPRELDAPAVADEPDIVAWLAGLGLEGRLGLHGRALTQLTDGEPVDLVEDRGGWVKVAAPWQPNPGDEPGYLGWVRRAHLREPSPDDPAAPVGELPADRVAVLDAARDHLGLAYLWGGTSPAGLDCSGLVHHCYRRAGVVVPRDAEAQRDAATPVAPGEERAGDLWFFGPTPERISHVGFVVAPGVVLHAPEDADVPGAGVIVEEALTPRLRATLVSAGRFLS